MPFGPFVEPVEFARVSGAECFAQVNVRYDDFGILGNKLVDALKKDAAVYNDERPRRTYQFFSVDANHRLHRRIQYGADSLKLHQPARLQGNGSNPRHR